MRALSIVAAATLVVVAAVAGAVGSSTTVARCNLWAAPYGADTNPGTQVGPFLTLGKLATSLTPGQTGCLAPGAMFANREVITAVGAGNARVTIRTGPGGGRAVLGDGIETT